MDIVIIFTNMIVINDYTLFFQFELHDFDFVCQIDIYWSL